MVTATFDASGLDKGLAGLARLGIPMSKAVAKETGELIKTLVKVSPPANPSQTRRNIESFTRAKFELVSDASLSSSRNHNAGLNGSSTSGIEWYRVDSRFLRGVAPQNDMRGASVDELRALAFTINRKGRQILPFRFPRKSQKVMLSQQILTKKSTVTKLSSLLQKSVGRLKAGWMVSVFSGVIKISGANMPPQWVTRHSSGAKGSFIDALGDNKFPSFTIINSAKGVRQTTVNGLVQLACNIRAKAMASNVRLYLRGKKNIGDYGV